MARDLAGPFSAKLLNYRLRNALYDEIRKTKTKKGNRVKRISGVLTEEKKLSER